MKKTPISLFVGKDVFDTVGEVVPYPSFKAFYTAHKAPQVLQYTQAKWKTLSDAKRNTVKKGLRYFVGGTMDGRRANASLGQRTVITLDVEHKHGTKPVPAPQYVADIADLVLGYECWVYTTLNHTPGAPRYRVVLPLDKPMQPNTALLEATTKAVAVELGIPLEHIDKASWALSQPMFLPAHPSDGQHINVYVSGKPVKEVLPSPTAPRPERHHPDALVNNLIEAGLYLHEDDTQPGKHYFTCPWHAQHGNTKGNHSQTVYYEPGSRKVGADALDSVKAAVHCLDTELDHDGKPHLTLISLNAWLREQLGTKYTGYACLEDFNDLRPGITTRRPRLTPQTLTEFLDYTPPEWLVQDLLPRAEGVLIQGASGAGKSFFALDVAMRLATNTPWQGKPVQANTWVAYIAAEGSGSIRARAQAWAQHHGKDPRSVRILFFPDTVNLAKESDCVMVCQKILEATDGAGVSAFFIDTLARSTAGLNENSSEMSLPLKHLQGMARATGGTPVTVHHLGKDLGRGGRGWSGIHADVDTVLEISGGEVRTLTVVKQRDGQEGERHGYTLEAVGDSAVVVYCAPQAQTTKTITGNPAALCLVMQRLQANRLPLTLANIQAEYLLVRKAALTKAGATVPKDFSLRGELKKVLIAKTTRHIFGYDEALQIAAPNLEGIEYEIE